MFNLKSSEKKALIQGWGVTLATLVSIALLILILGAYVVWIICAVLFFGSIGFCFIFAISMIFIDVLADEDDEPERADRLDLYRKQQRQEHGIDPDC